MRVAFEQVVEYHRHGDQRDGANLRALALTATAALAIMSTASSTDTPNPFIAKWALDLQKSTFHPGPSGMKSQTIVPTTQGAAWRFQAARWSN
jgi:hypothetical protein